MQLLIRPAVRMWRQTTAVVNRAKQDCVKSTYQQPISTKLCGAVGHGSRRNPLGSGADLDTGADPRFCTVVAR